MSYLFEAAHEMHFPTPHRGLTKRLETAQVFETGAIARAFEERDEPVPSDRYLWAAVGAVGVALSILGMGLSRRVRKVLGR